MIIPSNIISKENGYWKGNGLEIARSSVENIIPGVKMDYFNAWIKNSQTLSGVDKGYDFIFVNEELSRIKNILWCFHRWIYHIKPGGYLILRFLDYKNSDKKATSRLTGHNYNYTYSFDKMDKPNHYCAESLSCILKSQKDGQVFITDTAVEKDTAMKAEFFWLVGRKKSNAAKRFGSVTVIPEIRG